MENEITIEPPNYYTDQFLFDIDFHPEKDFICCGTIEGEARILSYNQDDTVEIFKKKVNNSSTRVCKFNYDGKGLITGNQAGGLAFQDESGKIHTRIKKAFEHPIYSLLSQNNNIISVGDDDGFIKIFDVRNNEVVYDIHEQENGTITDLTAHSSLHYLQATSTNGSLGVYDLRKENKAKEKLYALSDSMNEDLNCLSLVKGEQFVACGSEEGALYLYKWDWFGNAKDTIQGHPEGIETIVKYDENVIQTGCSDGWVRIVGLFPNAVKIFQNHAEDLDEAMPVTKIELSRCGQYLASISHDNSIKFYDLSEIIEMAKNFDPVEQKDEEMIMENNSSESIDEEDLPKGKFKDTQFDNINKGINKSSKNSAKLINKKASNIQFFDDL